MENLLREQYKLSREANISITESDMMPDFERQVHVNLLLEDKKREQETFQNR